MATDGFDKERQNNEDSVGMNCPLCLEVYRDPRALSCLHTFCCDCIHAFIMKKKEEGKMKNVIECPLCRNITLHCKGTDPLDWAKALPLNYALASLLSSTTKKSRKLNYEIECLPCKRKRKTRESSVFCPSCNEYQCSRCASMHEQFGIMMDHELVDIKKAKMDTSYKFQNLLTCHDHGKKIRYYCPTHDQLCCISCDSIAHRRCESVELKNSKRGELNIEYNELKNSLSDTVKKTKLLSKVTKENETKIDQDIQKIEKEIKQKRTTILKKWDDFEKQIRNEMVEKRRLHRRKNKERANKSNELNAAISGSIRMFESVDDSMPNDVKFVVLKKLKKQNEMFLEENKNNFDGIKVIHTEMELQVDNCTSKFCSPTKVILGHINVTDE